jgi:hypothetical protein
MGGFGHSYKTLEDKVRFHRKRAQHHLDRAAEWERILAEIQQLQRLEQIPADVEVPKAAVPKRTTKAANRNEFARELLRRSGTAGITPAQIRKVANEQGFPTPTNYPYKMIRNLVAQGRARKDKQTGTYFWVEKDTKIVCQN